MFCTAGCLSDNEVEDESLIDLVVYYDLTNGTIQQSFIGGSQISFTGVTFSFDFAYTTSEYGLESFYVDPGDGSPIIRSMLQILQTSMLNINFTDCTPPCWEQQTLTETRSTKPSF